MNSWQQDVKDFMAGVGQLTPAKLTYIDEDLAKLRVKLIQEELDELREALGFVPETDTFTGSVRWNFTGQPDLVAVADAIADIMYVTLGTAVSCGIDIEPIWNEVQKSNMTKLVDGYRREDGKWMKGPSFVPPDLKKVLEDTHE